MSKRRKVEAPSFPPRGEAEEFMAILLWSQAGKCKCPAAKYFRKMAKRMVSQYIKEEEEESG